MYVYVWIGSLYPSFDVDCTALLLCCKGTSECQQGPERLSQTIAVVQQIPKALSEFSDLDATGHVRREMPGQFFYLAASCLRLSGTLGMSLPLSHSVLLKEYSRARARVSELLGYSFFHTVHKLDSG